MKKFASIIMAVIMLISVMSVGMSASAATDASAYTSSETQSSMKSVSLNNGTITGTFNLWGYCDSLTVYVGEQNGASPSGTTVYSQTYTPGSVAIASDVSFTAALSDGGSSTTGYTVIAHANNGNWAAAYIPYNGPTYLMEIQRNGTAVSNVSIGYNEGTASGFSFVYESGYSYTYKVDGDAITVNKSGDNFTITPVAIGTATITATCNEVSSTTLTVTVVDDSTLTAQWYDTGATIANGAKLSGQATVVYGFGVEAFPDNYTVALSNNTANATYASSTVSGQYPNSIVAANEGSVTVTISGAVKTLSFTVNFTAAPEPVFGFYTDAACKVEAEPLVDVQAGATVTIYANESVASWNVAGNGVTYTSNANSITITGVTVDTLATVTAKDASGAELGWFDVYVTVGETVDTEPEEPVVLPDAFVFKVGNVNGYWATYDYQFTSLVACSFRDGVTYVPFRDIATAAGAKDIKFDADAATVTITNSYDMTFVLKMGETACTYTYGGQTFESSLNYAPKYIDHVCCLPVRDVANITFANVQYESVNEEGYVFVSAAALAADEITTLVNAYEAL